MSTMQKFFHLFISVTFIIISTNIAAIESALTLKQMEYAGKAIRETCQPQFDINDEIIDGMKTGAFPENDALKCYVNCMLEMTLIMRNGVANLGALSKQIHLLPEELREPYMNGVNACTNAADGVQGKCEIAYALIKCTHKNNPVFMFP